MYTNVGVLTVLSDAPFAEHRVIGATAAGKWAYTAADGSVLPLAVTTSASATRNAQGQHVTSAIPIGAPGAVEVTLAAGESVKLGTLLVAGANGTVKAYAGASDGPMTIGTALQAYTSGTGQTVSIPALTAQVALALAAAGTGE